MRQADVISRRQALRFMTEGTLRHRVESGRWRQVHRAIYVAHNGPVTQEQRRWVAVLSAGSGRPAMLAGLSALECHGMRGYPSGLVHVLLPAGRRDYDPPPGVAVHRTSSLPAVDVHRLALPPRTMPARSVVDAAQWAATDDRARAIVAAAFQQRLIIMDELRAVLARAPRVRRRALINTTALDAAEGSHSIAEVDFAALCRRAGLPRPTRQAVRRDDTGRMRYRDAYFEPWGVHVEVDGGQHLEVRAWWADMRRQNDLWIAGDRVLRFPAWAIRQHPDEVATQLRAALLAAGWRPGGESW